MINYRKTDVPSNIINGLQTFMEICIFINTIEEMEPTRNYRKRESRLKEDWEALPWKDREVGSNLDLRDKVSNTHNVHTIGITGNFSSIISSLTCFPVIPPLSTFLLSHCFVERMYNRVVSHSLADPITEIAARYLHRVICATIARREN